MSSSPVELLQALVRIPSVNPDGDPGTDRTGEAAMAAWLKPWLEELGFVVRLEEVQPGRPNLIARAPGSDDRPRILLGPHLDTVSVTGMTIEPFGGVIEDGKIWGRGATDTKGPMAAMLWGLHACRDLLPTLPVAIDFVGFMGEESGQWGSRDFAKNHGADYQFAIVGEPTSLDVVYCTKGSLWATVNAEGKAAHASQPERGDNAIMKLARTLDVMDRELRRELRQFTHPVLGPSTLNIGTITGGTVANIVPDKAAAQLDIRMVSALTDTMPAEAFFAAFLQRHDLPLTVCNVVENPPMEIARDHPWLEKITSIHPASKLVGAPWFSDAAHLSAAGTPSVCVGPGSIDQAHTKDEFIPIADLEAGAEWFTILIQQAADLQLPPPRSSDTPPPGPTR